MAFQEIKNNIYYCGLNDLNREYFDELVPLEHGTTYNSYLIKASEKTVLVDTMYPPKADEYIKDLENNNVTKVDYIVANHGEQDHTGALPKLLEKFPDAIILTNPKCKEITQEMLHIADERYQIVADGEEISLGDKTLKFIYAPWVHWPDTMFTYAKEDNLLFTCDFLGAHFPSDDILAIESEELTRNAKRYYAEIMMPFRSFCQKYIKLIREMKPEIVCPSHGPVYKNPESILESYEDWTSDNVQNVVLLPYVSMYKSVEEMINYTVEKLEAKGIHAKPFNVVGADLGFLAMELVDAATVVFGSSMVLAGPHPQAVNAAYLANILRPKTKFISIIGSYGWGGNLVGKLTEMLNCFKAEMIEPVIVKGKSRTEDFELLDKLVDEIYEKHKSLGLLK